MMKIESYLTSKFGKIDFSRFGSKRFAKFIDKQNRFKRNGTRVDPVKDTSGKLDVEMFTREAEEYARVNGTKGGNVGQLNNYLIGKYGKAYFKEIGFADFHTAIESVDTVVVNSNHIYLKADEPQINIEAITPEKAAEAVKAYADANAPEGGNIGQLNNELMQKFGKTYCADLGFADYKSMLSSMSGVYVKKNRIYPAIVEDIRPEQEEQISEELTAVSEEVVEVVVEQAPAEKPDMNSLRRDVLNFVANAENGGGLSALGKVLADKYGKEFLKEMGFTSMRKLAAEINGVVIKNNKLYLDEEFAKQTEEIEQFVIEFANSDGSRSIRSLGIKLKNNFDGFDFKNYGFTRFTDFINAIDGVKADR